MLTAPAVAMRAVQHVRISVNPVCCCRLHLLHPVLADWWRSQRFDVWKGTLYIWWHVVVGSVQRFVPLCLSLSIRTSLSVRLSLSHTHTHTHTRARAQHNTSKQASKQAHTHTQTHTHTHTPFLWSLSRERPLILHSVVAHSGVTHAHRCVHGHSRDMAHGTRITCTWRSSQRSTTRLTPPPPPPPLHPRIYFINTLTHLALVLSQAFSSPLSHPTYSPPPLPPTPALIPSHPLTPLFAHNIHLSCSYLTPSMYLSFIPSHPFMNPYPIPSTCPDLIRFTHPALVSSHSPVRPVSHSTLPPRWPSG